MFNDRRLFIYPRLNDDAGPQRKNLPSRGQPDGRYLAIFTNGVLPSSKRTPPPPAVPSSLRIYRMDGSLLQEVAVKDVRKLAWRPDSSGLLYSSGLDLEMLNFGETRTITVYTGGDMLWDWAWVTGCPQDCLI